MIITHFLIAFSSSIRLLSIPSASPASINGRRAAACFSRSKVRMPHQAYRNMRRVFSTRKTMQILALNELVLSVTLFRYAPSRAPIPYRPHRSPERMPMVIKTALDDFVFWGCSSRMSISRPMKMMMIPKMILMIPVSAFFKNKMPGMLPAATMQARGRQMFHWMDRRSFPARIILEGYPRINSTGEIFTLAV